MIAVDSSVWIDFFRSIETPETDLVRKALRTRRVFIADLVVTEVLQGFSSDRAADMALDRLSEGATLTIVDAEVAVAAARNYRRLRSRGFTPRKTIDTLIATRCILDNIPLLYSDRDFDPFVAHLGLRSALNETGVN